MQHFVVGSPKLTKNVVENTTLVSTIRTNRPNDLTNETLTGKRPLHLHTIAPAHYCTLTPLQRTPLHLLTLHLHAIAPAHCCPLTPLQRTPLHLLTLHNTPLPRTLLPPYAIAAHTITLTHIAPTRHCTRTLLYPYAIAAHTIILSHIAPIHRCPAHCCPLTPLQHTPLYLLTLHLYTVAPHTVSPLRRCSAHHYTYSHCTYTPLHPLTIAPRYRANIPSRHHAANARDRTHAPPPGSLSPWPSFSHKAPLLPVAHPRLPFRARSPCPPFPIPRKQGNFYIPKKNLPDIQSSRLVESA